MLGERVPIKSDKTRLAILRSQQLLTEVEAAASPAAAAAVEEGGGAEEGADDPMALYDKLFVAFNDALDSVRSDLRNVSKVKSKPPRPPNTKRPA